MSLQTLINIKREFDILTSQFDGNTPCDNNTMNINSAILMMNCFFIFYVNCFKKLLCSKINIRFKEFKKYFELWSKVKFKFLGIFKGNATFCFKII